MSLALTAVEGASGQVVSVLCSDGTSYLTVAVPLPAATVVPGADGQYIFNAAGSFAADGVFQRSGVAYRDVAIQSTHLLNIGSTLATNVDSFGTLTIGGLSPVINIGVVGGAGPTVGIFGGSNAGGFAEKVTNSATPTGVGSNGVRIVAGSNTQAGSVFERYERPDGTILANMSQSGAAFDELTFAPNADNKGQIGTPALRWALVRAAVVTSGDLHLEDPEREGHPHWILREEVDSITAINKVTGKRYRLAMISLEDE
jgi:hypothetical protein